MDGEFDDDDDYEDGFDSKDEDPTLPCPACGEEIYDDAQRCPACGHYLSREDAPPNKQPLWIIVGAVICLLIVILWAAWGLV